MSSALYLSRVRSSEVLGDTHRPLVGRLSELLNYSEKGFKAHHRAENVVARRDAFHLNIVLAIRQRSFLRMNRDACRNAPDPKACAVGLPFVRTVVGQGVAAVLFPHG